jgi:hypothetical protein
MMGHRQVEQAALFHEFSLETATICSSIGRPSVDPELMIRMLIIGYCFGIRSERRLCEKVHLNRWIGRRDELRHNLSRSAERCVIKHSQVLVNRAPRVSGGSLFSASIPFCLLASAVLMAGKPSLAIQPTI